MRINGIRAAVFISGSKNIATLFNLEELMKFPSTDTLEKVHNRTMDISTYEVDDRHILVDGEFREGNTVATYLMSGDLSEPTLFHYMRVRLLIEGDTFTIKDLCVDVIKAPYLKICRETERGLNELKGASITEGFTAKVKKIAGGPKGCSHVTALLLAMAPAAFQGYWQIKCRDPSGLDTNPMEMDRYLIDSCWAHRKKGPLKDVHQKAALYRKNRRIDHE